MTEEAPPPGDLTTKAYVEAALLRPLTTQEENYLPKLIETATGRLLGRLPSLPDRMLQWAQTPRPTSAIDPVVVADVLAEIIKRRLVNPKGLWSTNETSGPFSRSETYPAARGGTGAGNSPGQLQVTDDDIAQIVSSGRAAARLPRTARLGAGMAPENLRPC